MRKLMSALLVGAVLLGMATPATGASSPTVSIQSYGSTITVFGHGFGHGRGMGQFGAFGYATNYGWDYHQILDHYYSGSVKGMLAPNDPATTIKVRLTARDGVDTIVTNDDGKLAVTWSSPAPPPAASGPYRSILIEPAELKDTTNMTHHYNVYTSAAVCVGDGNQGQWTLLQADVAGPVQVTVSPPVDANTAMQRDFIGVCEASDIRYYRGDIAAVRDANNAPRTIDIVSLEAYVRGVVPRESPASWGTATGPKGTGMAALQAQAVAARSYAYASTGNSYSKICDTQSCQVYRGASTRSPVSSSGTVSALEDARSDSATTTTASEVRMIGSNVVATEYSSSTGGYTAGGTFPSVVDDGDSVSANPNHVWTTTVPRALIESAYPSIGTLLVIQVKSRNGFGDLGGRVKSLILQGTTGSVTITGWQFSSAANSDGTYRVLSDWFQVESSALTSPAAAIANGPNNTYFLATTDGGVLPFNGAKYAGSMLGTALAKPILGMAANSTGAGYWLLGGDGGIFTFGDALFYGSTGGQRLNKPVVGMAASPSGAGYWLVASDGGIFSFGDAQFYGSTGSLHLNKPVIGMAPTHSGAGYWLVASDGGIFSFGDAQFYGSGVGQLKATAVGISATASGLGYRIVASDGTVLNFGDAS